MPMTLEGKLGQLLSDGNFVGTAWLLSENLAISAYHCLLDSENKLRTNFTIEFPEFTIDVSPDDNLLDSALDVTVLKITNNHDYDLEPLVIDMSRTEIAQGDEVYIGGYPELSQDVLPNGNLTRAIVEQPDWPAFTSRRIVLSYPGGEPPNITGVSGGPLVLKSDQSAAIGLICSKYDDVQSLYATSIFNVVKRFPELEPLLLSSRHINSRSKRLCIDQTLDGQIRWSCSVPIDEAEKLWEDPSLVTHVICLFPLSNPSATGDALKRLFWNGRFTEILCNQADDTLKKLEKKYLELEVEMPPSAWQWKNPPPESSSVNSACSLPNKPELLSHESFVVKINNSLDSHILKRIHQIMEACESGEIIRFVGCEIEQVLWRGMYEVWLEWYQMLNLDVLLRHQYLTHCLLTTALNRISSRDSILLGPKTSTLRLSKPTIMALALAASDVPIQPYMSSPGNMKIGNKTGHACGVDRFCGRDVLSAASNAWLTDVVMLPYFNVAYLLHCQQLQSMRKEFSGTPRTMDPGLPPLVLTGDLEWQMALTGGKEEVKRYYLKRIDETDAFRATQILDSRDGGLKNAP